MSSLKPIGEVLRALPFPLTTSTPGSSRSLPQIIKTGREIESRGGGKERSGKPGGRKVQVLYLIARCFQCGGENWFALDRNNIRPYSKCQVCGEISPTESYIMLVSDYDVDGKPLWEKFMDRVKRRF